MDLWRICMESLDLTYKLLALKIKSKTLDQIYFMSQEFQEHSHCYEKRKKKKMKTTKIYLFFLPSLTSQDRKGGGGCCNPPIPQLFSWQKFLNFFS